MWHTEWRGGADNAAWQTVWQICFEWAGDVKLQLVSWQLKFHTNDTLESWDCNLTGLDNMCNLVRWLTLGGRGGVTLLEFQCGIVGTVHNLIDSYKSQEILTHTWEWCRPTFSRKSAPECLEAPQKRTDFWPGQHLARLRVSLQHYVQVESWLLAWTGKGGTAKFTTNMKKHDKHQKCSLRSSDKECSYELSSFLKLTLM